MDDSSKNADRAILDVGKAFWTDDPKLSLKEGELDGLLRCFSGFGKNDESDLRTAINLLFQSFFDMAIEERFREINGRLEKVPKPSTIVAQQMERLQNACMDFDKQLAELDPVARTWLDQRLEKLSEKRESAHGVRLRDLEKSIFDSVDILVYATRDAEGLASPGPNNTALNLMVERLANIWEICHGRPPITDKGRGLRDDPFLKLCQEMAGIADARLKARGGRLGTRQLSGIVADVLKSRLSRAKEAPQDK